MLVELLIENYAVIDRLRVRFERGFNLLTGETGSGKSIVVDALGLLLGGRASGDLVRTGAERARVSGVFSIEDEAQCRALQEVLEPAGLAIEDGELLIAREIQANGKSRAYVSNRPASASVLRALAASLGDIHGQHDQQQLFSTAAQLGIVDSVFDSRPLLERVAAAHQEWRGIAEAIEDLEKSEQEKLRLLDLWKFQIGEIEAVSPRAGEDEELESERRLLQNAGRIEEGAAAAYDAIYESQNSAIGLIHAAVKRIEDLTRYDSRLNEPLEGLRPAELALQEAAFFLRGYLSGIEANPARLDQIESRLNALDKLKRKYGATLAEVTAFFAKTREQASALENASERLEGLRKSLARAEAAYTGAAAALSAGRKKSSAALSKQVEHELASLAMGRARFVIEFETAPWSTNGTDSVRFLLSSNPGEEPRELARIASGGEVSRIALALKTCAAAAGGDRGAGPRTLVFDEVDAGVSGSAAEGVGRRLKRLSASYQVLCVTHLPQIACFADQHLSVAKQVSDGRTSTIVEKLDDAGRVKELARLLSGEEVTAEAMKNAERLLRLAASA